MVVTTGTFTGPAEEYAQRLQANNDPHQIKLIDGTDIREIGEEIGLDLLNGRIEILCDETLRPYDPSRGVHGPVKDAFHEVENIDARSPPEPSVVADFRPVLQIIAETDATFETSVGVIHRERGTDRILVQAELARVVSLVSDAIEEYRMQFFEQFERDHFVVGDAVCTLTGCTFIVNRLTDILGGRRVAVDFFGPEHILEIEVCPFDQYRLDSLERASRGAIPNHP